MFSDAGEKLGHQLQGAMAAPCLLNIVINSQLQL